jgi:hypothetical protein
MTAPAVPTIEAENGAALLVDVHAFLRAYVAFPSDAAAVAVTLWAVHTHMVETFESTPRLALLSPEKQCGKTRVLELLALLCAGAETLSDASAAYLFRRIGAGAVTVLLDEADAIWKRGKSDDTAEALRSIVNAGHRKGAVVGRATKTGQLERFPVYAPVALAGIGHLPDTILDRSVIVAMRRRAPDEHVAEYRERMARPEGEALADRLASWSATVVDKVGCPWPDMPSGVTDRPADVWEPLLAVAELAGGDWPARARAACVAFVTGSRDDIASVGVRLLGELRDVFGDAEAMWTETILAKLHSLDEAPWGDWYGKPLDPRGLAKLLKPYGVKSQDVRHGETNRKGYQRANLWDVWTRYLPKKKDDEDRGADAGPVSATSATSATPLIRHVADVADVADNPPGTRPCGICSRPFRPDPPSRAVCDTCVPHLVTRTTESA